MERERNTLEKRFLIWANFTENRFIPYKTRAYVAYEICDPNTLAEKKDREPRFWIFCFTGDRCFGELLRFLLPPLVRKLQLPGGGGCRLLLAGEALPTRPGSGVGLRRRRKRVIFEDFPRRAARKPIGSGSERLQGSGDSYSRVTIWLKMFEHFQNASAMLVLIYSF